MLKQISRQGFHITPQQKVSGNIERIAEEEIATVHPSSISTIKINHLVLAFQRAPICHGPKQRLDVSLKAVQVAHAVPGKLRPDELAAVVPLHAVRGEDAVAEKGRPLSVELLALAKVVELRGQHGFDVFGVGGEGDSLVEDAHLAGPRVGEEDVSPELHVLVGNGGADAVVDEV